MTRYASKTNVGVAQTKGDIEQLLTRYGAEAFSYGWEEGRAIVGFRMLSKFVKLELKIPLRTAYLLSAHDPPRERTPAQVDKAWEQGQRSTWRALLLVIKGKLEAVESGITTFEEEFMAHLLLPSGETVGQVLLPQVEDAYRDGVMPKLLPYSG